MAEKKKVEYINAVEFCRAKKALGRIRVSQRRWDRLMRKSEEGYHIYFPAGYYVIGDNVLIKFLKFLRRLIWIKRK